MTDAVLSLERLSRIDSSLSSLTLLMLRDDDVDLGFKADGPYPLREGNRVPSTPVIVEPCLRAPIALIYDAI
jgi:hypothetical protein